MLTNSLMQAVGLKGSVFKIGHVGVLKGVMNQERLSESVQNAVLQLMDKRQYDEALKLVEKAGASGKCMACLGELVKLKGSNASEVLDRTTELVADYENSIEAANNLREVLKLVSGSGCKIDMFVEAGFARGLEYYTGMVFETYAPEIDIALGGGGRYDRLIELFGGEPTPAVGVAHGIDRMLLAVQSQKAKVKAQEKRSVLVIAIKEELRAEALRVSQIIRDAGLPVEVELMGRKVAKALEDADRRKMSHAVIVGERELKEGAVVVRNLVKREQSTVKIENVVQALKS
jgi:histidyl-tRNA synthetase